MLRVNYGMIIANIVFCKGNVEEEDDILYLPWYMAIFFKQEGIPIGLTYKVDLNGL